MMQEQAQTRREALYRLLGDLPARDAPLGVVKLDETAQAGYVVETLVLDLNGIEPVPACLVRPRGSTGPLPAVLYSHAHGGDYALGKQELLAGRAALQQPPYAQALTDRGYAVLCIDAWGFGERQGRSESAIFKQMLWEGRVLWGMMVFDSLRALDYLAGREDVDASRMATLGLSMGSTMSWWVAALDERVRVCVDLCCLTDYQALIETQGLDEHGIYYYVPRLLRHFSAADINALIAPRAHLSLAGTFDRLTPVAGLDRIDAYLRQVYADLGASTAWQLLRYAVGHMETAAMRRAVLAFLAQWL
jgi:hypothetical protein